MLSLKSDFSSHKTSEAQLCPRDCFPFIVYYNYKQRAAKAHLAMRHPDNLPV